MHSRPACPRKGDSIIRFSSPIFLLLLPIAVVIAAAALRYLASRETRDVLAYSSLAFAERVFTRNVFFERIFAGCVLLGVASAPAALAGPHLTLKVPQRDGAIVLCVDTSGSMASTDIMPTRSQAALHAMHVFVDHLPPGIKIGVVSFSTNADTILSPDDEHDVANQAIDRVPAPNGATAIGDALMLSEQLLPKAGRRAVVLLTDGVNNRGSDPLEAAHDLAAHRITLYTVGIGTNDSGQTIPGTDEAADADPDALRNYAEITGGSFAEVKNANAVAAAFLHLSREATWQAEDINAALPTALTGAGLLLCAVFFLLGAGRLPSL